MVFVGMVTFFLITYTFHCTWVTSEAYSSPSIVLSARSVSWLPWLPSSLHRPFVDPCPGAMTAAGSSLTTSGRPTGGCARTRPRTPRWAKSRGSFA